MPALYRFLGTHEVLVYLILAIAAMFGVRWLAASWSEWRHAVYGLEKEFSLRRMGQSLASLMLVLFLFLAEFVTATFIYPSLPASMFVVTATPDFLATPTETMSAEVATSLALTPRSEVEAGQSAGCVEERIMISSPRSEQEIRGVVEIRGTVNIPDFGFYKYEVASRGTDLWATIAAGRERVVDGKLGQWDTTGLTPGDYQLRLVVSDNQGQGLPPCVINVRVSPPS